MCVCVCVCARVRMSVCTRACAYVCAYACVCEGARVRNNHLGIGVCTRSVIFKSDQSFNT